MCPVERRVASSSTARICERINGGCDMMCGVAEHREVYILACCQWNVVAFFHLVLL